MRVSSRSFRPSETKLLHVLALAQQATATFTFWICPVHAGAAWDDNIAKQKVEVNLWKTTEVSYPPTLGNGT
jgi:hypothetical protein